jgi:hypothetical protein
VAQASPDDGAGQSGHLLQFGTGYPCRLLGTGNRICLWCNDPPEAFPDDNAYSLQYGVAGMPEYSSLPAQPTPREDDRYQLEEMDWAARGFIISDRPYYNVDPFPQVD